MSRLLERLGLAKSKRHQSVVAVADDAESQMIDSVNELTDWFYKKEWNRAKSMSIMLMLMRIEPFEGMDPTQMQILVEAVEDTAKDFVKKHGKGGQRAKFSSTGAS